LLKAGVLSIGLGMVVFGTFTERWIFAGLGVLVVCASVIISNR